MRRELNINIGNRINKKRKEKQINQKQLAEFVGVSKASVSKWETGHSYPDITLLPLLAAYFDISVDQLIGYESQLSKQDIQHIYQSLKKELSQSPIETYDKIQRFIRTYWSCPEFIFEMANLILNHLDVLFPDTEQKKKEQCFEQLRRIYTHVAQSSSDIELVNHSKTMEAYITLLQQKPDEALKALGNKTPILLGPETLIAAAYQMKNESKKAQEIMQSALYQYIVLIIGNITNSLPNIIDDEVHFKETIKRAEEIIATFDIEKLHPVIVLPFYLQSSLGFKTLGNKDQTLNYLEKYVSLIEMTTFPTELHGDDYFYLVDNWLKELRLGSQLPRNSTLVEKELIELVIQQPLFKDLEDNSAFKELKNRLLHLERTE